MWCFVKEAEQQIVEKTQADLGRKQTGAADFQEVLIQEVLDLRGHDVLPGCGHWTQQERPAEVNERLNVINRLIRKYGVSVEHKNLMPA